MIKITDDDIIKIENLLLPEGQEFNCNSKSIIQCMESKDIHACPGSGKTTTLLAKLGILSWKLPLNNNEGICVLTHTNVAINEIKDRLGNKSNILFNYPNYCGTIQSFVNKYLAIPAYAKLYGKKPVRIDNDIYYEMLRRKYYEIVPRKIRFGIEKRDPSLIYNMRFDLDNFQVVKGFYKESVVKDQSSDTYKSLLNLKVSVLKSGILCFDDAFVLANWYLTKFPEMKNLISKRFSYLFFDEMQDTMRHQNHILQKTFNDTVVCQKIGDNNQSIYDNSDDEGVWTKTDDFLSLPDSKRFSCSIANIVKPLGVEQQNLTGNSSIPNINPTLIVFSDSSIGEVIPRFGELIINNKLHLEHRKVFKAIGWVTNQNAKGHTLVDYWARFKKNNDKKVDYKFLISYLKPLPYEEIKVKGAQYYKQSILRGLLKCIRIMDEKDIDNRHFTEKTLLKLLKEQYIDYYNKLLIKTSQWCLAIQNGIVIYSEVKEFIEVDLCYIFKWENIDPLSEFLQIATEESIEFEKNENIVRYRNKDDNEEIDIAINTIHGVKGETHTATLYLETFYHGYDIARIIEYLKGNYKPTQQKRKLQNLKMTYVGITRPSHLLCIGVHKKTVEGHIEDLKANGWDIIDLTNSLTQ